jgi:hypothetical protein
MGFDSYPLTTLENKKKWLGEIARAAGWRFSGTTPTPGGAAA